MVRLASAPVGPQRALRKPLIDPGKRVRKACDVCPLRVGTLRGAPAPSKGRLMAVGSRARGPTASWGPIAAQNRLLQASPTTGPQRDNLPWRGFSCHAGVPEGIVGAHQSAPAAGRCPSHPKRRLLPCRPDHRARLRTRETLRSAAPAPAPSLVRRPPQSVPRGTARPNKQDLDMVPERARQQRSKWEQHCYKRCWQRSPGVSS